MSKLHNLATALNLLQEQEELSSFERSRLKTLTSTPEVVALAAKLKGQTAGGEGTTLSPAVSRGEGAAVPSAKAAFQKGTTPATSTVPASKPMVPQQAGTTPEGSMGRPLSTGAVNRKIQRKPVIKLASEPEVDEKGNIGNWLALAAPLLGVGVGAIAQKYGAKDAAAIGFAGGASFSESYFTSKRQRELDEEGKLERDLKRKATAKGELATEIEGKLAIGDYQGALDVATESGNSALADRTTTTINALILADDEQETDKALDTYLNMASQVKDSPAGLAQLAKELDETYPDNARAGQLSAFFKATAADTDDPEKVKRLEKYGRFQPQIARARTTVELAGLEAAFAAVFDADDPEDKLLKEQLERYLEDKKEALEKVEGVANADAAIDRVNALSGMRLWGRAASAYNSAFGIGADGKELPGFTAMTADDIKPGRNLEESITRIYTVLRKQDMDHFDAMAQAEQMAIRAAQAQQKYDRERAGKAEKEDDKDAGEQAFPDTDPTEVATIRAEANFAKRAGIDPDIVAMTDNNKGDMDKEVAEALSKLIKSKEYMQKPAAAFGRGMSRQESEKKLKEDLTVATDLSAHQKREVFRLWQWAYEDNFHRLNQASRPRSRFSPGGRSSRLENPVHPRKPNESYADWRTRTMPKRKASTVATPEPATTATDSTAVVPAVTDSTATDSTRSGRDPKKAYGF